MNIQAKDIKKKIGSLPIEEQKEILALLEKYEKLKNHENVATVIPKIYLSMGASASLRAKVGNRDKPEERLAIIKQFYPDAIPTSKTINIQTEDPNDSNKKINFCSSPCEKNQNASGGTNCFDNYGKA